MSNNRPIAFFDFDGTLVKSDSFIKFAIFTVGKIKFAISVIKALPHIVLWKLGLKTGGEAKERLFGLLFAGMHKEEWERKCTDFIDILQDDINQEMIKCLKEHSTLKHTTVIVTASIADWVRPWAKKWGINNVIGTEIEIDKSNIITGRFKTKNCHGIEKVNRVKIEYPAYETVETWGYGDSESDRFLCKMTTHGKII
ncbi:MAG: haloacid dehalogenase-like hydrolase [Lachnospiraceae bacterium]|nr:haloacid dehalogenase-like hydrolase [Lachnospiraceae bacterium]